MIRTVTIVNNALGPWSAYDLLTKTNAQLNGVTVLPLVPPLQTGQSGRTTCHTLKIQNDPTGTAAHVYVGDSQVKADGTVQGVSLVAGATDTRTSHVSDSVSLANTFINSDTGGAKVNLDATCV